MILRKLILGAFSTNCYVFGTDNVVVIIDPGGESKDIINLIEELNVKPNAILLTHGHIDHVMAVGKLLRYFEIPLMYNKKEYDLGIYKRKMATRWIEEGDTIEIENITLNVLETPGHSPGALCLYSNDIKELNGQGIEGIIFTGDLIFRRSIGRSDVGGGNQSQLFSSIKNKIMYNPELTDNFIIFPGHMDETSIGEERKFNVFKDYFL